MNELERDDVPWGRPVLDSIPLPPFASPAAHLDYTRALQTHVGLLDTAEPSLATITLLAALEADAPSLREPGGATALSPLELRVSMASFFPAPWTPRALADALVGFEYASPVSRAGGWHWDLDPSYSARPMRDGGWEIERFERGSRATGRIAAGDLVLLWMDRYRNRFPFPVAHMRDEAVERALAPAATAVRRAHASDVAMPYLVSWREERDAALAAVEGESPPGAGAPAQ